jgi:hypothetical protein
LVAVLTTLALVGGTGVASASPGSLASAGRVAESDSTFCQLMAVVNTTGGEMFKANSPAAIRSETQRFKSGEPTVLSVTPSAVKGDLQKVLALDNLAISAFAKAGYNASQIPSVSLGTIEKNDLLAKPAYTMLASYVFKTCGLKLPPLSG